MKIDRNHPNYYGAMSHEELWKWGEEELNLRLSDMRVAGVEGAKQKAKERRNKIGMNAETAAHFVDHARREKHRIGLVASRLEAAGEDK